MDSVLNGINKSSIFSCACVLAHELMNHSMKIHFWHETEYFGQWPKFTQKKYMFFETFAIVTFDLPFKIKMMRRVLKTCPCIPTSMLITVGLAKVAVCLLNIHRALARSRIPFAD